MQLFSEIKNHWSTTSVFGSICIFSNLSAISYSQEIRSALQTYCPVSENTKIPVLLGVEPTGVL